MDRLASIAMRIAAPPPMLNIGGDHLYKPTLEASNIPKEWKKIFKNVLEAREEVLLAIPDHRKVTDFRAFKNLNVRRGPLIKAVKSLMNAVKEKVPSADWTKYEEALSKMAGYEFEMGQNLPSEASDWVFEIHGIISEMFRLIDAATRTASLRIAEMPKPINLTKRSHLTMSEANNSDLDPNVKKAIKDALNAKSDFQAFSIELLTDPGALRGLGFAKDGVVETIRALIKSAKISNKEFDSKKFDDTIKSLADYQLTSNIAETNVWSSYAHELITAVFEALSVKKEKTAAVLDLHRIAMKIAKRARAN